MKDIYDQLDELTEAGRNIIGNLNRFLDAIYPNVIYGKMNSFQRERIVSLYNAMKHIKEQYDYYYSEIPDEFVEDYPYFNMQYVFEKVHDRYKDKLRAELKAKEESKKENIQEPIINDKKEEVIEEIKKPIPAQRPIDNGIEPISPYYNSDNLEEIYKKGTEAVDNMFYSIEQGLKDKVYRYNQIIDLCFFLFNNYEKGYLYKEKLSNYIGQKEHTMKPDNSIAEIEVRRNIEYENRDAYIKTLSLEEFAAYSKMEGIIVYAKQLAEAYARTIKLGITSKEMESFKKQFEEYYRQAKEICDKYPKFKFDAQKIYVLKEGAEVNPNMFLLDVETGKIR